ncbi:MAG: DNA-binding protein [Candidatus Binatia bacterium]
MNSLASLPFRTVALSLALASLFVASGAVAETAPMRATEPAAPPMPAPAAAPKAVTEVSRGKVVETMDAAGYTYAHVATPGGEVWVAGPRTVLSVGDSVGWPAGSEMKNFQSKTLGRSFESILFVDALVVSGASAEAPAAAAHGSLSPQAGDDAEVKDIARAEGGLTVGEIFDRRKDLEGKEVVLRGKVVKFNGGVMKRNWLHLRDGSRAASGENDLTVTSDGTAAVGDVVVVRGKLALNKDFGFGYRYDVLLEDARLE